MFTMRFTPGADCRQQIENSNEMQTSEVSKASEVLKVSTIQDKPRMGELPDRDSAGVAPRMALKMRKVGSV